MNALKNIFVKGAMAFIVSLGALATPHTSRADVLPATVARNAQAANMLYVWGYSRYGLEIAVQGAIARGFAPIGFPRFVYVPEAGRYAWIQNIVFVGY